MKVNVKSSSIKSVTESITSLSAQDYKTVLSNIGKQEQDARNVLGIEAKYSSLYPKKFCNPYEKLLKHLELSKLINAKLLELKEKGYPLPNIVLGTTVFKNLRKSNPPARIFTGLFEPTISPDFIFINPFTSNVQELTLHEVGHFLHYKNFPNIDTFNNLANSPLTTKEKKHVHSNISTVFQGLPFDDILKRYNYLAQNVGEFVAFHFTEAVSGKTLPSCFSDIYHKYSGPQIII